MALTAASLQNHKPMEHTLITPNGIKIGDHVMVDKSWGRQLGGQTGIVEDIKLSASCRSGYRVRTNLRKGYYDSGWFILLLRGPMNQKTEEQIIEELKSSEIF